jgi:glycosyltransferase involved in cell wall biosynthesis
MKLFIDALGASAGGGLTYLWNVLPQLAEYPEMKISVLADSAAALSSSGNVSILQGPSLHGSARRFWWEQTEIPKLIRKNESEVLLCTGNFAIWNCPVPQILLSRNSLYTSPDFNHDLRRRGEYRLLGETRLKGMLARQSIRRAELTISPSEAFALQLESWAERKVAVLHHGFDADRFLRDRTDLPSGLQRKLQAAEGTVSLLFVSHYNYYRNFETLFKALALLKERLPSRKFRLVLTCELADGANPGAYRTEQAKTLVRELEIEDDIVQLGAVDYFHLHHVYRACDLYVTPAYTETFAHPLVEAMASGLPIVASDISVHREIAREAALFFEKFSANDLAEKVTELLNSPSRCAELRAKGLQQASRFSWKQHVERLVEMAAALSVGRRQ